METATQIAEIVTGISTAILAAATIFLIVVGKDQIKEIRKEAQKTRTLEACNRYDNCPIILAAAKRLREAWDTKDLQAYPASYRVDAVTLLNYLDSLAIGIRQNLYIENLARDHLGGVLIHHTDEYFTNGTDKLLNIQKDNYPTLIALSERWKSKPLSYIDS